MNRIQYPSPPYFFACVKRSGQIADKSLEYTFMHFVTGLKREEAWEGKPKGRGGWGVVEGERLAMYGVTRQEDICLTAEGETLSLSLQVLMGLQHLSLWIERLGGPSWLDSYDTLFAAFERIWRS